METLIQDKDFAKVRVFHAATNFFLVDVFINDQLILKALNYGIASQYIPLKKGKYNIKIYRTDNNMLLYNETITIDGDKFITMSAVNDNSKIELIIVEDQPPVMPVMNRAEPTQPTPTTPQQTTKIRFIHLSPNAPGVDLSFGDGTKVFTNTKYKENTNYKTIRPGNYTINILKSGTDQVVFTIPNLMLMPNMHYTVYAIGLVGGNPPLEAIVLRDGI